MMREFNLMLYAKSATPVYTSLQPFKKYDFKNLDRDQEKKGKVCKEDGLFYLIITRVF